MINPVGINMKKDKIIIRISEEATHEEIIECLNQKILALKKLYKTEKTPIYITGKALKNKEIEEIKKIITDEIEVEVTFDSPETLGLYGIKKAFEKEVNISETKYYKGSIRSGNRLEFEGSIVIVGDLNAGAEAIAGENIIILGALRGLAHAGAKGNKKAIIATNNIDCPQLRIANIVKELEKEEIEKQYKFASVDNNNEIILE